MEGNEPSSVEPPDSDAAEIEVAVAVAVVDVLREPREGAERVTQALLGLSVTGSVSAGHDGWIFARLPDYQGWMRTDALATPARQTPQTAVVAAVRTPLYTSATGMASRGEAYVTTALPVLTASESLPERVLVALPGDTIAWVTRGDVEVVPSDQPLSTRGVGAALMLAQRLLGTPYLWGGTSPLGVDCSGLVQLCYRWAGCILPRDADQQYAAIPYVVEQGALRAGDLAYFARDGHVVHVGMLLDQRRLLHADGTVQSRVTINALSADAWDDTLFSPRLAHLYAGARRPLPDAPDIPLTGDAHP